MTLMLRSSILNAKLSMLISGLLVMLAAAAAFNLDVYSDEAWMQSKIYWKIGLAVVVLCLAGFSLTKRASVLVFASFLALTTNFISIGIIVSTILFFTVATVLGMKILRYENTRALIIQTLLGVFFIIGTLGWILPYQIHGRPLYIAAFIVILWLCKNELLDLFERIKCTIEKPDDKVNFPKYLALGVICLSLTNGWMPTIQYDELAYHGMLPLQLRELGYFRFDVSTQVWAFAPWGADLVHGVIGVLGQDDARGATNIVWFLMSCLALFELASLLRLASSLRWLCVALYACQPCIVALLGTAQVENELVVITLCLLIALIRFYHFGEWKIVYIVIPLFGMLASLKTSQVLVAVPFALAFFPAFLKCNKRYIGAICLSTIIFCSSSYLYAGILTGNPFLPLFNGYLKSPYFPVENFFDSRWTQGLTWKILWDLTFSSSKYQEISDGGVGLLPLMFAVPLLLGLRDRMTRLPVILLMTSAALMFFAIQYFRYILPIIVATIPLGVFIFQRYIGVRPTCFFIASLIAISIVLIPRGSYTLRDGALVRQVKSILIPDSRVNAEIIARAAYEIEVAEILRLKMPPGYSIYLADAARPFIAPFAGRGFTSAWYDNGFKKTALFAGEDLSGERWLEIFSQAGINYVLMTETQEKQPALEAALASGAVLELKNERYAIYCLCKNNTQLMYRSRDNSQLLQLL